MYVLVKYIPKVILRTKFQTEVNAGCWNVTSVTLNENLVLFGHDIHFISDNTFHLIILQANFFIRNCKIKTIPPLHLLKRNSKTNFEVYKCNAKLNMSHDKIVTGWCFYQKLIDMYTDYGTDGKC